MSSEQVGNLKEEKQDNNPVPAFNSEASEDFFGNLEQQVNGVANEGDFVDEAIRQEATTEVTRPNINGDSERVTHQNQQEGSNTVGERKSENDSYEKRYRDSSREATKMAKQLKDLKPFIPVLDAMKKDTGLVRHVREYLENGGTPSKTIKEQMNLPEDFVYDAQDAIENPESPSAKVMEAQIDKVVNNRVGSILTKEKENTARMQQALIRKKESAEFKKRHNMSDDEFDNLVSQAKERKVTLDDVYYLINKDKTQQNVANSTRKDMLNQMKNVRNMPVSQSNTNSQAPPVNADDKVFDALVGNDSELDNLFG
jgi:hypothetical protein